MSDITPDEMRGLARMAGLRLLDEDVEPLTLQFNALREALGVLDEHDLYGVAPLPALQYPAEAPGYASPSPQPSPSQGEGAGSGPSTGSGRAGEEASSGPSTGSPRTGPTLTESSDAPLAYKPITELAHLLRTRQVSSVELTRTYLDRIERFDGELRSYVTVTAEFALEQAARADEALARGEAVGPLTGIPLAHKDEFYTKDILTTCGSSILSEFVPDFDATPIARLHEAGAVMLGKLNMTEFASPVTWVFPYGQPRNPWNLEHDAGGSSTGSGIAVAAALCVGSLAEDTGGSIRRPASNNGAVGIRPTLGRVSTHGMIASSWYQDTAGPIARSVADCALLLEAIAGFDANDLMSARLPVPPYSSMLDGDIRGMRVAVVKEAIDAPHLDPRIRQLALDAIGVLRSLGAEVEEVSLPLVTLSGLINNALSAPRAALQWTHLNETPELYDVGVRRNVLLPALLPAVSHNRALQLRSQLRTQTLAALERFDVAVVPAYAQFPPRIVDTKSEPATKEAAVEQMRKYGFHTPANYSGAPAMSVPMGFSDDGLPMGLHVMAKRFDETSIFRVAHAYEQATPWHTMRPPYGDGN